MHYCKYEDVEKYIKDKEKLYNFIENPKTFICYLFPYYNGEHESNISKYARGKDYHIVVREKLEQEIKKLKLEYEFGNFYAFCDNSPLPEVEIAYFSGCGILGKNHLIFDDIYGGYVFIGIIATDIEIEFEPKEQRLCINCKKCIKACPGGAINEKNIDLEKCLSHLTQLNKELTKEQEEKISKSKYIWGCDICLDVCPMNKKIKATEIEEFSQNLIYNLEINKDITRRQFLEKFPNRAFTFKGPKPIIRNLLIKKEKNLK